jgi:quercetin dioxygenase-like cupin family protein
MNGWKAAALVGFGIVLGAGGFAAAQAVLPAPTKGYTGGRLGRIDLGKAFPDLQGYVLQVSRLELPAHGGGLPLHSHKDMPEIVYIVQGHITEQINGGPLETYGPGSALIYDETVSHSEVNLGNEPVVYIGAHVAKAARPAPKP